MTAQERQAAAGSAATATRGEMKQEWFKKPLWLHAIAAVIVVVAALIINSLFNLNLFGKLILGMGLMWGGGKMTKAGFQPVSVWGKVLRGLGGAVIVLALLKSGLGLFAEKTVNTINNSLTELATGQPSQGSGGGTGWFEGGLGGKEISLNLRHLNTGGSEVVTMSPSDTVVPTTRMARRDRDGDKFNVACPTVEAPEHLAGKIFFHIPDGAFTDTPDYEMTDESKLVVIKSGLNKVKVKFTVIQTAISAEGTSSCLYLKHPAR